MRNRPIRSLLIFLNADLLLSGFNLPFFDFGCHSLRRSIFFFQNRKSGFALPVRLAVLKLSRNLFLQKGSLSFVESGMLQKIIVPIISLGSHTF